MLHQLASLVQLILLSAALPLSLLAARGYWGTPWGRVLAPIPVIEFGVISYVVLDLLPLTGEGVQWAKLFLVVVPAIAAAVSAIRLGLLVRRGGL